VSEALKQEVNDTTELMAQLDAFAKQAANAVKPHIAPAKASVEQYKKFLDIMYHYTLTSGEKLTIASKRVQEGQEDLKDFFDHMAHDEHGHYLVAKADLKAFDEDISYETPSVIVEFNQFWQTLGVKNPFGYLGALYVFENVARHLLEDIPTYVKTLELEKTQVRFVMLHAEADDEHGDLAKELCEKYIEQDPAEVLGAAEKAADLWARINLHALAN
jgi:hypothetical protein